MESYLFIVKDGGSCYRNACYFKDDNEAIELAKNYSATLYKVKANSKILLYKPC